jgi:hypothetical protein
MIGNIQNFNNFSSVSKNAFVITDYADDYILQGKGFSIEKVFNVNSADTQYDITFDASNFDRNFLVAYPTSWLTSAGPVIITLGVCDSYSGGSLITPVNRNYAFQASYLAQVIVKNDVVPVNYVASETSLLVGTANTPLNSGGGQNLGKFTIWLQPGLKYIFRINNQSGEAIFLQGSIFWFEF